MDENYSYEGDFKDIWKKNEGRLTNKDWIETIDYKKGCWYSFLKVKR